MMSCMLRIVAGVGSLICDGLRWLWLTLRSTSAVEVENLFLRRQLALYLERGVKPRRIDSITRIALTILSGFFDWRDALVVVRPQTLIRWHRAGWKLFWRLKSRPGRPPIPAERGFVRSPLYRGRTCTREGCRHDVTARLIVFGASSHAHIRHSGGRRASSSRRRKQPNH